MAKKPLKPIIAKRGRRAAAPSIWEPTMRVGYIVIVAVFVAIVAGRVNRGRAVEMTGTEPGVDPLLLQPVKNVDLNLQSIRWALEALNKASPVRVELDAESFAGEAEAASEGPPPRPLRLKDQTVGEAVAAILARFDRPDRPLSFIVENGWVILGSAERLAGREASVVRAYGVGDLLEMEAAAHAEDKPAPRTGWVQGTARSFTQEGRLEALMPELGIKGGRTARVAGRWLIVEGTPRAQRDVQRALFILRHGEVVRGAKSQPATRATTGPTTR